MATNSGGTAGLAERMSSIFSFSASQVLRGTPWSVLFVGTLFIFFGMARLDLPGPYPDEVLQAAPAAAVAAGVLRTSPLEGPAIINETLVVNHHIFPFVMISYLGPVKTYVLAVVFWVFGANVPVMRITTLAIGFVSICYLYLFARTAMDRIAAEVATVLVGSDPSFLVSARDDWGPIVIGFALKMVGMYFLARWWRNPQSRAAPFIAGLSLGLGLSHKADFAWFLLAAAPIGLVLYRLLPRLVSLRGLAAILGFEIGSLPLLYYNAVTGWKTWVGAGTGFMDGLRPFLVAGSPFDGLIRYLVALTSSRGNVLLRVFDGNAVIALIVGQDSSSRWSTLAQTKIAVEAGLILATLLLTVVVLARFRKISLVRPLVALVVTSVGIFLQILLTPAATGPHHSIAVYPFPQIAIGFGFTLLVTLSRQSPDALVRSIGQRFSRPSHALLISKVRFIAMAIPAAAVAFIVLVNIYQLIHFQTWLVRTGGAGFWSDGIYDAAAFIEMRHPHEYVETIDWGIRDQLILLIGPTTPVGFWGPGLTAAAEFEHELAMGKRLFVLHSATATLFKEARSRFLENLTNPRYGQVRVTSFNDRSGQANVSVVEVAPIRRASLFDDLANATIVPPLGDSPPIGVRSIGVDGNTRHVLLQHPTSSISFHLTIPQTEPRLVFATIIDPTCWSQSDGASFKVGITDGPMLSTIFSAHSDPKANLADQHWHDTVIDLSRWGGKNVDLILETGPGTSGYMCSWAEWGEPEILSASDRP
jgi:hypothetical protein